MTRIIQVDEKCGEISVHQGPIDNNISSLKYQVARRPTKQQAPSVPGEET
jgi:hypothetical protein